EGEVGMGLVHLAYDAKTMPRPVQEIRIAEGHVRRARFDLERDVAQHDGFGKHEKSAAVRRRYRAMTAEVQAPAARFDVTRDARAARVDELGVARQRRQRRARRRRKIEPRALRLDRRALSVTNERVPVAAIERFRHL